VENGITIRDADKDSLWAMPLGILPLKTTALRNLRLIKNNHLEGVVEMFRDSSTGGGHIRPKDLRQAFAAIDSGDVTIVSELAPLPSFDVYSLRISLRKMGITVTNSEHLKLSDAKQNELSTYLRPFTERIIIEIYGSVDEKKESADLAALFKDPDVNMVRQKLKMISEKLNVELHEVPQFLEDYGDIYLSIGYYRQCLDATRPTVANFLHCTEQIMQNSMLSQNSELVGVCKRLRTKVTKLTDVLADRFAVFKESTEAMWEDMSGDRFDKFKRLVEDNHGALGGLLCTLSVKMNDWGERFPSTASSGPSRWADHIMTDMRQGF